MTHVTSDRSLLGLGLLVLALSWGIGCSHPPAAETRSASPTRATGAAGGSAQPPDAASTTADAQGASNAAADAQGASNAAARAAADLRHQSPIDLPAAPPSSSDHHRIALRYDETAEHLVHRDHTIELQFDPGSELEFDGSTFMLDQLHFHTPSEHLIAHQRYPVELHLVHHSDDDRVLVLGVLFEVGAANGFVERVLTDAPRDLGRVDLDRRLNVAQIFPADKHFYSYEGSLTTAPYNEGVQWLILSEHPSISPEQVVRLLVLEGGNARTVQPLNDRSIDGD